MTQKSIGIAAAIPSVKDQAKKVDELFQQVQPDDLVRFGLIPEFIGRLPVAAVLDQLSEATLIDILTKPKNSLVKQYQKLMSYEGVDLIFTDEALKAIAQLSLKRKTGARGLRSVIETAMMDVMYEIPSMKGVKKCIIDKEVITDGKAPSYRLSQDGQDDEAKTDVKKIKEESA